VAIKQKKSKYNGMKPLEIIKVIIWKNSKKEQLNT